MEKINLWLVMAGWYTFSDKNEGRHVINKRNNCQTFLKKHNRATRKEINEFNAFAEKMIKEKGNNRVIEYLRRKYPDMPRSTMSSRLTYVREHLGLPNRSKKVRDIFNLISEGKTAKDLSKILGISSQHARLRVRQFNRQNENI